MSGATNVSVNEGPAFPLVLGLPAGRQACRRMSGGTPYRLQLKAVEGESGVGQTFWGLPSRDPAPCHSERRPRSLFCRDACREGIWGGADVLGATLAGSR